LIIIFITSGIFGMSSLALLPKRDKVQLSNAEKLTSRFWVLNRKLNGSFQVSFLFKTPSKNREVIFCVRLSTLIALTALF
jgi:hypothetical protein